MGGSYGAGNSNAHVIPDDAVVVDLAGADVHGDSDLSILALGLLQAAV